MNLWGGGAGATLVFSDGDVFDAVQAVSLLLFLFSLRSGGEAWSIWCVNMDG